MLNVLLRGEADGRHVYGRTRPRSGEPLELYTTVSLLPDAYLRRGVDVLDSVRVIADAHSSRCFRQAGPVNISLVIQPTQVLSITCTTRLAFRISATIMGVTLMPP